MRTGPYSTGDQRGFTLLELIIVVSILAIVASIGVPQYVSALRTARIGKAKHELVTISNAIGSYAATNEGKLPLSLHQVGYGGKLDPWGVPYCYLNYGDGTGDGLEWAIDAGIVDPAAFGPIAGGGSDGGGSGGTAGSGTSGGGLLPGGGGLPGGGLPGGGLPGGGGDGGSGAPMPQGPVVTALDATDITSISTSIGRTVGLLERVALEQSVRTHGNYSLFTGVPSESTRRRDRYLFPLNTDFDLFSLGPDHDTATSLSEAAALDDVIRANNGGFFGVAADY